MREWHAAWLAERPEEATLEEMRRRLIDRAAAIRAKPPPRGKDPKSFTHRDLARLERIARRGALRLRFEQFRSMLRRDVASKFRPESAPFSTAKSRDVAHAAKAVLFQPA